MGNRLAQSSSPYLLQHAENPVEWHEWGEEAFALARERDVPVLLSIGYAACHWCHVMEHESFEDAEVAAVMNRLFVNVKVDREQRPDIDRIYQTAHQVMNRRGGGWPLTAFLDPHTQLPFFIGTYFPKHARYGMPEFGIVLQRVAEWYGKEPEARAQHNEALREFFEEGSRRKGAAPTREGAAPTNEQVESLVGGAQQALEQEFDPKYGGFSPAPKFPQPAQLAFLLGRDDPRALHMAHFSLKRMCLGGLYDHLGGGWYRYSVDERWEIPHFEKMLYDNGLLLACATRCWQRTGDPVLERAVRLTAGWALREMRHPEGGFFSSLDADSEGEEGKFYAWDADTVREALDDDAWRAAAVAWGLERAPNFEGKWHLHGDDEQAVDPDALERARARLFALRDDRVRPGLDDKVLAGWNGLMVAGLARAGRVFGDHGWVDAAAGAVDFVRRHMWRDGALCVSWRGGVVLPMAFLDDHAYLLDGLVELMRTRFRTEDLDFARALADALLERYSDEAGGFFFTADDHEALVQRPISFADDATPNGNGVAALALLRLGHLVGEPRYLEAAAAVPAAAGEALTRYPHAHAGLLPAIAALTDPAEIRIVRGTRAQLDALPRDPHADTLEFRIPVDEGTLPGQLAHQTLVDGAPTLYRCVGTRCDAPVALEGP